MNVLRLESLIAGVVDYLTRLKVAVSRIDTALWLRATLQNDLESLMTRLNEVPDRVQEWKKSSARCGADVALSLVRVHCKEAREEKLAAIKVANTKKHDFQSFMETFIPAATRIADGIDLDEFAEPASLLLRSEQSFMLHLKFAWECQVDFVAVKLLRAESPSTLICGLEPLRFI